METKLIYESASFDVEIESDRGKPIIYATLQSFDVPNINKRIYPFETMKPAIESFKQLVANREAFGEFGHPYSNDIERLVTIHPQFVSHIIRDVEVDENKKLLKGVIYPTGPYGKNLIELAQIGAIGFSARVLASWIRESDYTKPVPPIRIICYDAVIRPSHREAYIESIRFENATNINNDMEVEGIACDIDCAKVKKYASQKGLIVPNANFNLLKISKK